ncbi:MAG: hypothetical protein ACRD3V_19865, partial [Vicinamibacteria bacterium]
MGRIGTRRSLPAILLFLPVLLGVLLVFFPRRGTTEIAAAADRGLPVTPGPGLGAEELLFLLQYVGSDYSAAVADGAVLDEFEYQEMLEFSRVLVEEYGRIASPGSEVGKGLDRLQSSVVQ